MDIKVYRISGENKYENNVKKQYENNTAKSKTKNKETQYFKDVLLNVMEKEKNKEEEEK